ncbi:peptidase inhibitor family I36 protein [Kitasatospora sp. A2-31]|uniref:peptidase inhibitor family I36 protein n=1 Tax=Kitasatospora sp. A2-31 TaxID=2916414 RepID=UPI001EEAAAAF|nr:peptidase inhibitor family I36 protein [Kitasatospora sp. A2-31]MCG6494099.1 peptidase inhibitor family I36 protein [Kitasatospora sp. A2-31]
MKHTDRFLTGATAAVVALSVASVSPAHAADGYDRCPVGYYCMFSGLDGTGSMIKLTGNTPDLKPLSMDDQAESDWNRTSSTIHLNAHLATFTAAPSPCPSGHRPCRTRRSGAGGPPPLGV